MFITYPHGIRATVLVSLVALWIMLDGCAGGGASNNATNSPSQMSASTLSAASMGSSSLGTASSLPISVAPDSPLIRYTGRVNLTPTAALYDWADTQIEFRVNAEQVALLLNDDKNNYNLFIDGQLNRIITAKGNSHYDVNLGAGDHHLQLTKRTGPNFGSGQFLGLRLSQGGYLLDLSPAPTRKIEFIGDSYTVGYGNEAPTVNCGGIYRPYENSYLSYAPIAARALDAQSHSIAISGFGAVRNFGDPNTTSATPVPFYYDRTLMERADLPWNFKSWIPDTVVIKLGTNDFGTQPEPPAEVFIQGIRGLIAQVRTAYGDLPLFLLADSSMPNLVGHLQNATQQEHNAGHNRVYFVQVAHPPQNQLGCDWHPAVAGHEAMAAELVAAIKPILGWDDKMGGNGTEPAADTASVTPFKGGAKGAYSLVLDDYCGAWTSGIDDYGIPGMLAHGLRSGIAAIAAECEKNHLQARLKNVSEQGFEIINHSWSHPALVPCAGAPDPTQNCSATRPDFTLEIDKARDFLQQATGTPVTFFAFPYNAVDEVVLNHLRNQGYLGARGGGYAMNLANFNDPIKLNLLGNQADMNALAEQAVKQGAFAIINLHGIADSSFEPVPLATWNTHLDYLKSLVDQHDLWVDTPTAIVKYNRSKALCGTPLIEGNSLRFTGAQTGCSTYVTGLTVEITRGAGLSDLHPVQKGVTLPTRRISTTKLLIENVDPRFTTQLN